MTSNAIIFEGSTVEIGQGDAATVAAGADTFDAIGEVKSTDGPGGSTGITEVSHAGSPAVEKVAGLKNLGTFSIVANYLPTDVGHLSAIAAWGSRQLRNIKHTLPSGDIKDFKAFITSYKDNAGVGGAYDATIVCEVSGDMVLS